MSEVNVKFIRTGAGAQEVTVSGDAATVRDLLTELGGRGVSVDGLTFQVNGSVATPETPLENGARVVATPKVQGGN